MASYAEHYTDDATGPHTSEQTMLALLDMGSTEADIMKVASLKVNDKAIIRSNLVIKPTIESFIKEANANDVEFKPIFAMTDLIKIAAVANDAETVDKVLGLGYLNANTIQKNYFEYIPQLEDTAQRLSKLLLDIRLGALDMDGTIVSEALESLSKLIVTLKRLKQTKLNRRK